MLLSPVLVTTWGKKWSVLRVSREIKTIHTFFSQFMPLFRHHICHHSTIGTLLLTSWHSDWNDFSNFQWGSAGAWPHSDITPCPDQSTKLKMCCEVTITAGHQHYRAVNLNWRLLRLNYWPDCVAISRYIARKRSNSYIWFTRKTPDLLILKSMFSPLDCTRYLSII